MKKHLLYALAGMAIALAPGVALAQNSPVTGDPTNASDMKGPPANGYGTDTGLDKGSTVVGGAGSHGAETPSAKDMKGSPNANGYSK